MRTSIGMRVGQSAAGGYCLYLLVYALDGEIGIRNQWFAVSLANGVLGKQTKGVACHRATGVAWLMVCMRHL